jgi:hypothetical protein
MQNIMREGGKNYSKYKNFCQEHDKVNEGGKKQTINKTLVNFPQG